MLANIDDTLPATCGYTYIVALLLDMSWSPSFIFNFIGLWMSPSFPEVFKSSSSP